MGKKGKNTAKKKAARQKAKAVEKENRELKKNLPARLDALLAKGQEETKDIDLFADPPPQEVCPICEHQHSFKKVCGNASWLVHSCCGKKICRGCIFASHLATDKINVRKKQNKEPLLHYTCAFCREPQPSSVEEDFNRFVKRMALNDANSIHALASMNRDGYGTPEDKARALDLFCRAAELGVVDAYHEICLFYREGIIVDQSEHQDIAFAEIAAKKGDIMSRHDLGFFDSKRGNLDLAIRHLKIAAEAGLQLSLDALKRFMKKDNDRLEDAEFANILEKCLESQAEMKTDQRDAWAKYMFS